MLEKISDILGYCLLTAWIMFMLKGCGLVQKGADMNTALKIEYEVFEDLGTRVLSVVDESKDKVINMFHDEDAEELFCKLITVIE